MVKWSMCYRTMAALTLFYCLVHTEWSMCLHLGQVSEQDFVPSQAEVVGVLSGEKRCCPVAGGLGNTDESCVRGEAVGTLVAAA